MVEKLMAKCVKCNTPLECQPTGRPPRYCGKACRHLGHWTPHEMRHSAASLLLVQGVALEVVSELLGHSSIRMTKDVYGHLLRPQMRRAADAMDALLGSS